MKPVLTYYPHAEVYFLGSSWDYFHGVEARDLVGLSVSLNVTGSPGTFSITLNNKGDRYFVADSLDDVTEVNTDDTEIQQDGPIAWLRREHFIEEVELDGRIYVIATDPLTGERFYWKDGEAHTPPSVVTRRAGKPVDLYTRYRGLFEKGKCIIRSMDRVAVFLRRRYPKTPHEMIRVFTGIVSNVEDRDSGTSRELVVSGEDVTKWLRLSRVNVNPSLLTLGEADTGSVAQKQYTHSIAAGLQGWEIVELMIAGGNLKDYGADDVPIRGVGEFEVTRDEDPAGRHIFLGKNKSVVSNVSAIEIFQKSRLRIQVPTTSSEFVPYKRYFNKSGWGGLKSEYRDRASILSEVAKDTNFLFYADGDGNLNYHVPRFDLRHILAAPNPEVYVLDRESIISWALSEDDKDLWSRIEVTGRIDWTEDGDYRILKQWNWYENKLLIARYGLRVLLIDHPFVKTTEDAFYLAKTLMIRLNRERLQGQVTITGRPELRQGYPVYLPDRNMLYNVMTVDHAYSVGDTFTTSVGLAFGRKPWDPLPEMLDYSAGVDHESDLLSTHSSRQNIEELSRTRELGTSVRRNSDLTHVVIHHTASMDDTAYTLGILHRVQMQRRNGLGYDAVILKNGTFQIGNRWVGSSTDDGIIGRATLDEFFRYDTHRWAAGCDAQKMNLYGVHVCLIGDFNLTSPTAPQMKTLVRFLKKCVTNLGLSHPHTITGHNHWKATDCPGSNVNLSDIRLRVSTPQEVNYKRTALLSPPVLGAPIAP